MKVVKDSPERRLALEISGKELCLRSGASSHAPGGFPCPGLATDSREVGDLKAGQTKDPDKS